MFPIYLKSQLEEEGWETFAIKYKNVQSLDTQRNKQFYLKFNLRALQIHADLSDYLLELASTHVFNLHNVCYL